MLTSIAAGKGLVLLAFGMLGWYISMAVGSPTMRQGLFKSHFPARVLTSSEAQVSSNVTTTLELADGGLGVFYGVSRSNGNTETSSQETKGRDGAMIIGTASEQTHGAVSQDRKPKIATRHASKVARSAVPIRTFTIGGQPNRTQLGVTSSHPAPTTCPPLEESDSEKLPRRSYPNKARGNCSCIAVAPFILLSTQRSGSGWLETLLNSHPSVRSHGEVFQVRKRGDGWREMRAALEEVFEFGRVDEERECLSAVGFKWMLNQGALQYRRELAEYARERGVSIVLLLRRNSLRRLISVLANIYDRGKKLVDGKEHRSHVHSREEADRLAHFRPRLNPATLLPHLRHVQRTTDAAIQMLAGKRHLILYYEDILADPRVVDRLQDFLGVPPRLLQSKQVQIHRQGLEHHIANWAEVKSTLTGTEFEHMLQ